MKRQLPAIAQQLHGLVQQQAAGAAVGASSVWARYSSELAIKNIDALKSGPGGRSSVSGVTATIFGCNGFLARYVAQALGKIGCQLVLPYRTDDTNVQHLRPMGDLGQVVLLPDFDPRDVESYKNAIKRSNLVINCIGADQETWNYTFEEVHVDIPARIAQAVREVGGIERVMHVSCLGANADAPSRRLRTKWAGEEVVRSELGPISTIFKPAQLTGTEDRLFNMYAQLAKKLPFIPLINGGKTKLQPVWVRDVVLGMMNSLKTYDSLGKTYHLAGPEVYSVAELVQFTHDTIRERNTALPVPATLVKPMARVWDIMARKTPLRPHVMFTENYINETAADFTLPAGADILTFSHLDVEPHKVTEGIPIEYLRFYRSGGYDFGAEAGAAAVGGGGFGHPGSSHGQNA